MLIRRQITWLVLGLITLWVPTRSLSLIVT
ncbi:hypothetical protein LINPERHAP2_LOCUS37198 [Linum perenne]